MDLRVSNSTVEGPWIVGKLRLSLSISSTGPATPRSTDAKGQPQSDFEFAVVSGGTCVSWRAEPELGAVVCEVSNLSLAYQTTLSICLALCCLCLGIGVSQLTACH